jgi:hypothetical protein
MTTFREETLFQMFSAAGDPSGFGLFKMVIIPDRGEIPAPAPPLLPEGLDHRMVFREGPRVSGLPDGPRGSDPAVRINRRVFPRVDVHRPAQCVPGEPDRPRDEPVIEGGTVVRGHRRLVGPAVADNRNGASYREAPAENPGEDLPDLRRKFPMDDELTQMKAAVEPAIADIDQAEVLQGLRRRRRPGDRPGEVHRTVHDRPAIRHISLPQNRRITRRRRHPSIAILTIDQLFLFLSLERFSDIAYKGKDRMPEGRNFASIYSGK